MTAMMSMQELKDLKLNELTEAARGWGEVSKRAYQSRKRVDGDVVPKLTDVTKGMATTSAAFRLGRLSRNYQYIHTECGLLQVSLDGLAEELAVPQRNLLNALAEAQALGFTVHPDGSVSYPAAGDEVDGQQPQGDTVRRADGLFGRMATDVSALANPNPNAAKAQHIADAIGSALVEAQTIDGEYAAAVRRLKAEQGLDVTENSWADVSKDAQAVHGAADDVFKDDIPTGGSPAERKAWWDGLSEEDRIAYMAAYPDTVGNLDGIPSLARDEANRTYLPQLMGKLADQGDEASMTKLAGLQGIQDKLNTATQPPMLLLGIGDEGNGRAIVAFGNPDTSKNVSAYVPGLGTKLDAEFAGGTVKRAFDTAKGAQEIDPSSASIVWLGYDAPQDIDVMSEGDAQRGAPAYNSFMEGLSTTNTLGDDAHITAIGHSYGSLTVGQATQMQPGGIPGVDDIILVGSPGVGVDKATDLGVDPGHVFVGAADNDVVTKLPSKDEGKATGGGAVLGGILGTVTGGPVGTVTGAISGGLAGYGIGESFDRGHDDIYFGKDPASEAFGATRFRVDPGPELVDVKFPEFWETRPDLNAHSNYFTPEKDQISANNIAAIVAGEPGKIIPEARR
ncbi:alpha/beta hydrolase [Streptomyces sp. NPDC002825]|uniref:alpha/beta hydrolase n=1 Tax=Streptomyces sp. NPDC002825 TaxID=3154666 RepID=UPI00332D5790